MSSLRARPLTMSLLACAGLALASIALPYEPAYDPWAWLVWGRELAALDLDTGAGPSWKPLPALVSASLSLLGDAAPEAWLVLARFGWLAAIALSAALAILLAPECRRLLGSSHAARFAPSHSPVLAGGLAAAGALLVFDGFTSWQRQAAVGLSEPLLAAICLGAVLAALERRAAPALALAVLACLLRPEAWAFAAIWALWLIRRGELRAWIAALGGLAIVTLWFVPDLLAAGDAFEGAGRAREATGTPPLEVAEALGRAALMPLFALWAGAALAVARGRGAARALALGALAWVGLVALMAAGGYAGLPRFMAPAALVLTAVGAAALAAVAHALRARAPAIAAALVLLVAVDVAWRVERVPGELARAAADAGTIQALAPECPTATAVPFLQRTYVAWELEVPLGAVTSAGIRACE